MNKKIETILALLDEHYPTDNKCYLHYNTPWQLLIATILSAQCTDDRVNMVTADLFVKYGSLEAFAFADLGELETDIHSTGFYHHKAKHIINTAQTLLTEYGGVLPSDIQELTKLQGVGRKTANVVRGHIFNIPSIVVDTHVKRVSNKLGLAKHHDPVKIEFELMNVIPESHWIRYNTQIIAHGRKICKARKPLCGDCFLRMHCANFYGGSDEA